MRTAYDRHGSFYRISSSLFGAVVLMLLVTKPTRAQEADTLHPMFGVGQDEFFIGAWQDFFPLSFWNATAVDPVTGDTIPAGNSEGNHSGIDYPQLWDWCESMGINVVKRRAAFHREYITTLDTASNRNGKRIIAQGVPLTNSETPWNDIEYLNGYGIEAEFLMVDSARFASLPMRFALTTGGVIRTNSVEANDFRRPSGEMLYNDTTATANQVIATDMTIDYRPEQTTRWHNTWDSTNYDWVRMPDSVVQGANIWHYVFGDPSWDKSKRSDTCWVVVKGHLIDPNLRTLTASSDTTAILKIEVIHETPFLRYGSDTVYTYVPHDTTVAVPATENRSDVFATLYVTREQLKPTDPQNPEYDAYREAVVPFSTIMGDNGYVGPNYPDDGLSERMNLRVTWLGTEDVAIRSVAIRDSIGQLLLGETAASEAYRQRIVDSLRANVLFTDTCNRVESIIGLETPLEVTAMQSRAANRLYDVIRKAFNSAVIGTGCFGTVPDGGTDSIPGWYEGGDMRAINQEYDPDAVIFETGTVDGGGTWKAGAMKLPYGRLPTLREHNGGRFIADYTDSGPHAGPQHNR